MKRLMSVAGFLVALSALASVVPVASAYPVTGVYRVDAHDTNYHTVLGFGDVLAIVSIEGDGDSDLDIRIYDENWNLIDSSLGYSDFEHTSWTPDWTGIFYVEVENLGGIWNEYYLTTDMD